MPAKTPRPLASLTVRFSMATYHWLHAEAKARAEYLNDFVGRILEDAQTWFGLPPAIVAVLDADRKTIHKSSLRDYIVELLVRRYDQLQEEKMRGGPAAKPSGTAPKKR